MVTDDNPFDDYNQLAMGMLGNCVMAWSHVEVSTDTAVRSLFFMSGLADDAAEMIALNLGLRENAPSLRRWPISTGQMTAGYRASCRSPTPSQTISETSATASFMTLGRLKERGNFTENAVARCE